MDCCNRKEPDFMQCATFVVGRFDARCATLIGSSQQFSRDSTKSFSDLNQKVSSAFQKSRTLWCWERKKSRNCSWELLLDNIFNRFPFNLQPFEPVALHLLSNSRNDHRYFSSLMKLFFVFLLESIKNSVVMLHWKSRFKIVL